VFYHQAELQPRWTEVFERSFGGPDADLWNVAISNEILNFLHWNENTNVPGTKQGMQTSAYQDGIQNQTQTKWDLHL